MNYKEISIDGRPVKVYKSGENKNNRRSFSLLFKKEWQPAGKGKKAYTGSAIAIR